MGVAGVLERARALVRSYLTAAGKQAAYNLVWLTVLTGLAQVCGLGSFLLLNNGRPIGEFGVLAFAMTMQPCLHLIGTCGLTYILFREGVRHPQQLDEITTAAWVIELCASMSLGLLIAAGAFVAPISPAERVLLCLIAAGNVAASMSLAPLYDVHHRQPRAAACVLLAEVVALAAFFGLWRAGNLGLAAAGAVFAGKWAFSTAAQVVVYHFTVRRVRLTTSVPVVRALVRSSAPIMLGALLAWIPVGSGVLFVRLLSGDQEAGIFAPPQQIAQVFISLGWLGIRVVHPHVAGPHGLEWSFVRKLVFFTGGFLGLLFVGGLVGGVGVMWFFLAPEYRAGIVPLPILLGGTLLYSIGTIAGAYLVILHRERSVLVANVCAGITYVVVALLLVPRLAGLGAAVATALAAAVGLTAVALSLRGYLRGVDGGQ
jgi:O-antigen/teichoic acid export membrane protein